MIVLLAAHLAAALAAPTLVRHLGRRTLALLGLVPASAAAWAALNTRAAFSASLRNEPSKLFFAIRVTCSRVRPTAVASWV